MHSFGMERVTEALMKASPYLRVIILTDVSHSSDGLHVFIGLVRVNVVKGVGRRWIAIGCCEINANLITHKKAYNYTLTEKVLRRFTLRRMVGMHRLVGVRYRVINSFRK